MASLIVLAGSFVVLRLLGLELAALDGWQPALRGALAAMFLLTGVAHFGSRRPGFIQMVPLRLPSPALLVTVTGVLELAGASGLLLAPTYRLAAGCLAVLLIFLFPANVYAARSSTTLGGKAVTPLPLRTAMQLLYVGCCLAVALS